MTETTRTDRPPVERRAWRILMPILSGALALVLAEVVLARWFPFRDPFARFKGEDRAAAYIPSAHEPNYGLTTTAEPGLPGVRGSNRFTTNALGFRGDRLALPKPREELRVFLVGGSTMECLVLDDSQSIERVLQNALRGTVPGRTVRVYNAAKSGDKSYDHLAMLAHRIAHLEPDVIVVFAGLNDLRAAVYNVDYLHMHEGEATKYSLVTLMKFASTEFQIPRRLYAALHGLQPTERERLERITLLTDYREKASLQAKYPVSHAPPRIDPIPYATNLRSMVGVARTNRARLAFMTQASTWNSGIDPKVREWHWLRYLNGVHYGEDVMDRALETYNDAMRRVAAETATSVLDLPRALPKSLEFFYDDAHFNVNGARATGLMLADFLTRENLLGTAR